MEQTQQQEKTVTLELTIGELNAVLQGLTKVELGLALSAWAKINQQAEQQLGKPTQVVPQGDLAGKVIQ
jgi:hypothetical protein